MAVELVYLFRFLRAAKEKMTNSSIRSTLIGCSVTHLTGCLSFVPPISDIIQRRRLHRSLHCPLLFRSVLHHIARQSGTLEPREPTCDGTDSGFTCRGEDQREQGVMSTGGQNQEDPSILSALNSQDAAGRHTDTVKIKCRPSEQRFYSRKLQLIDTSC